MDDILIDYADAGIVIHKFGRRIRFREEKINDKERLLKACLWLKRKIVERYHQTIATEVRVRVGRYADDYIQERASILISFDYFVVVKPKENQL